MSLARDLAVGQLPRHKTHRPCHPLRVVSLSPRQPSAFPISAQPSDPKSTDQTLETSFVTVVIAHDVSCRLTTHTLDIESAYLPHLGCLVCRIFQLLKLATSQSLRSFAITARALPLGVQLKGRLTYLAPTHLTAHNFK